jgi:hypothetical protein
MPLSTTKLPRSALEPVVDKMADKLPNGRGKVINHSDCLSLIKSTLLATPTYTAMCIQLMGTQSND